ncbi:hypothetical protein [Rufibacter immobilis]|uniref:hypothetical protein n=1 Tax=Rufibacter immobilis TaxID=1348778 RepID=UPI0035E48F6A
MALYGTHPPLSLAEDPSDPVWHWFICNGPHGERFTWEKPSYAESDLHYLENFIDERAETIEKFYERARTVALKSLEIDNHVMIRTAIQVLCVIGQDEDLQLVLEFVNHEDKSVRHDAKACLFERGIKFKKEK